MRSRIGSFLLPGLALFLAACGGGDSDPELLLIERLDEFEVAINERDVGGIVDTGLFNCREEDWAVALAGVPDDQRFEFTATFDESGEQASVRMLVTLELFRDTSSEDYFFDGSDWASENADDCG